MVGAAMQHIPSIPSRYSTVTQVHQLIQECKIKRTTQHMPFSIFAVVTAVNAPTKQPRGQGWALVCQVRDPSCDASSSPDLTITIYEPTVDSLPAIRSKGDILLARPLRLAGHSSYLRVHHYANDPTNATTFIVFPFEKRPNKDLAHAFGPGGATLDTLTVGKGHDGKLFEERVPHSTIENNYAKYLIEWSESSLSASRPPSTQQTPATNSRNVPAQHTRAVPGPSNRKEKSTLQSAPPSRPARPPLKNIGQKKEVPLSELRDKEFYVLFVQVVRKWSHSDYTSLTVTDYSENECFYDAALEPLDPWDSSGHIERPPGRRSLEVALWGRANHNFANHEIKPGMCVRLYNLRTKYSETGNLIEGHVDEDRQRPNSVGITILRNGDPHRLWLEGAREAFFEELRGPSKPSKKAEKNKARKARLKELAGQQSSSSGDFGPISEAHAPATNKSTALAANSGVFAAYSSTPFQPLKDILDSPCLVAPTPSGSTITYPFMNRRFRAKVRCVDFYPPKLEDFTQSLDDTKYNDATGVDLPPSSLDMDSTPKPRWVWHFWLLVEDASTPEGEEPARMKLLIAGEDALYLLQLDACDLRRNPQTTSLLKHKLWSLWGELEDDKSQGKWRPDQLSKARPFEVNIMEYGLPENNGRWQRLHRVFETTIHVPT